MVIHKHAWRSGAWLVALLLVGGCSGGQMTTREKGAGIGALGGAAAGGIIGAAVGRPGVGAAVGGVLGLGTEHRQAINFKDKKTNKPSNKKPSINSASRWKRTALL